MLVDELVDQVDQWASGEDETGQEPNEDNRSLEVDTNLEEGLHMACRETQDPEGTLAGQSAGWEVDIDMDMVAVGETEEVDVAVVAKGQAAAGFGFVAARELGAWGLELELEASGMLVS